MLHNGILLVAGLIGLWMGAIISVDSGKALARRLGVSPLLIGLTVISVGTSLPEIMVSLFSGIKGSSHIAVGTVVGSCVTQITLILGLSALVHPIIVKKKALKITGKMLLVATFLFWFVLFTDLRISQSEAALLIIFYIAYLVYTVKHDHHVKEVKDIGKCEKVGFPLPLRLFFLAIGLAVLIFSADLVLNQAVFIAEAYGLAQSFIGVMIIGVAACLPELSAAVISSFKKAPGLAIGILLGSNITDPMLSVSVGALFHGFETDSALLYFDIPLLFLASILVFLLLSRKKRLTLGGASAFLLITVYVLFATFKILS